MKMDEKLDILTEVEEGIFREIDIAKNLLASVSGEEALNLTMRLALLLQCLAELKGIRRL